jgi:hypothetical protein
VTWAPDAQRWQARIWVPDEQGKSVKKLVGTFISETDAARAYDLAARERDGIKAQLNIANS